MPQLKHRRQMWLKRLVHRQTTVPDRIVNVSIAQLYLVLLSFFGSTTDVGQGLPVPTGGAQMIGMGENIAYHG